MAGRSFEFAFALAASINSSFNSSFTVATQKINNLKASFENLNHIQSEVNNAYTKKIISEDSFKNAQKQLNIMNRGLQKAAATEMFQKSFIDATAFYYGAKNIIGFLAGPVQEAMRFESVMADVKKVVDFDTPEQFRKMGDDITNLSKNIPMTAEELAKIVAAGGQSGIARQDLTAFAESAAKMGVAFDITADQAGDMMAKWRTAFKMNQQDVVTLADKINYLGNTTAASAPLISDVVTRIGPLGAVGGLASGEIAAMGASLVGSGIQSEVAATGLKNFILAMTAGESATKKQNEAFAALGFNAQDMAERMQKDAKGAIIALLSSMKNLDAVQQPQVLKDLFGKESIQAIAPLLSNLDELKKNFNGVADATKYSGSMQAEFDARSKTTENSVKLMENRMKAAQKAIGNGLLPVVTIGAEYLGKFATAIGNVATEYPGLTSGVVAVAGAIATLIGASHLFRIVKNGFGAINAIFNVVGNLSKAWGVISKLSTVWTLLNGAMAGMPIGWVLIGISALVVGGTILYKNWDKVKAFFTSLWESPTARILMFITGPIGWLFGAATYVISHWDELKSYLQYFWDNPSAAIFRFQNYLKEQIQSAVDWVFKKWEELKNFLSNPISLTGAKNMLNSGRYDADLGDYDVDRNASGGIYGKGAFLTTFAEESGESAIPHTPTRRNISLLAETNRIMGSPLGREETVINASFAPNITINAGAGSTNEVMTALRSQMEEERRKFEEMLSRVEAHRRRTSYA